VEEIEPGALIGCKIGTPHVPWTVHVHDCDQLAHHVFFVTYTTYTLTRAPVSQMVRRVGWCRMV